MDYQEYLDVPIEEVGRIEPGEVCEDCKAGVELRPDKYPLPYWPPMYWHPIAGTNEMRGCNAFRIHSVRDGYAHQLEVFEKEVVRSGK